MTGNMRAKRVQVIGALSSFAFQRAKFFALQLHRCMPHRFPVPEVEALLELDWYMRLKDWRHLHGSQFWLLKRPVAVFIDDIFIGSDVDLFTVTGLGNVFVESIPRKNTTLMKKNFREEYLTTLRRTQLVYCYLDICVDDNFIGTLVFQLYSNILPKTCENFTTLCLGTKGSFLTYKGSRIHRIVKHGWLQGGDIQYGTGGGGFNVYCNPLEDECYGISHDRRGVLSMANDGKHTNGSQFFITLNPSIWMDTYYVAFGRLIQGVKVLNYLESVATFKERPLRKIEIKNCGKLCLKDVDDIDAKYAREVRYVPKKKEPKKIEKIADQIVRLIMEAVTESLAAKEHIPDVVHEGDVPSAVNLDLYFQGLYSLPEDVLEESAKTLRTLRREFLRQVRPSATEVVEVIAYDLLVAALTKLVDLDDVRETVGHPMYEKLVNGIDMEIEMVEKSHVKKFVDQLVNTAETMVNLISRKLNWMRRSVRKTRYFQDQMSDWVRSFVLQETFVEDGFRIADRPPPDKKLYTKTHPCDEDEEIVTPVKKKEPKDDGPCCGAKKVEEKPKKKKRLGKEQTAVDICCDGKEESEDEDVKISDFFSSCRYKLKKAERNREGKMPLLDLIEIRRYELRFLRHQEKRQRSRARICLEKKINRWMKDMSYVSETEWVRQTVFSKEDVCISHTEEIMYGAMTVGLLEMYFLMEEYLKHPRKKKYRTRVIYPDDECSLCEDKVPGESSCSTASSKGDSSAAGGGNQSGKKDRDRIFTVQEERSKKHGAHEKEQSKKHGDYEKEQEGYEKRRRKRKQFEYQEDTSGKVCTCGDVCCDCTSDHGDEVRRLMKRDSNFVPPTPPPSLETVHNGGGTMGQDWGQDWGEDWGEGEGVPEGVTGEGFEGEGGYTGTEQPSTVEEDTSCISSTTEIDVEELLAQVTGESVDKIDVKSFRWMQDYILEKGCLFKSEFVGQVHNWLENEVFAYQGFLSKHSLVTRASLLSFSFSLASLLREDNVLKTELKDFIYDLWELYFKETFKEALLQYPPSEAKMVRDEGAGAAAAEGELSESERGARGDSANADRRGGGGGDDDDDPCAKIQALVDGGFDFEKFCREQGMSIPVDAGPEKADGDETETDEIPPVPQETTEKPDQPPDVPEPAEQRTEYPPEIIPQFDADVKGEDEITDPGMRRYSEEVLAGEDESRKSAAKKRKSPIIIRELIESIGEIRKMPPYVLPFWVKFLTEVTKRAVGLLSKMGRLPRRLYFITDSQISFDDKMKAWVEFNRFSAPTTGGRDIRDYIAGHHVSLEDLDATARGFLRKKVMTELVEKSSRANSAQVLAEELLLEIFGTAMERAGTAGESSKKMMSHEVLWSDLIATVAKTSSEHMGEGLDEDDEKTIKTDREEEMDDDTELVGE